MGGGKGGSQTIGYKHHVGMHMVLCHGPIDKVSRLTFDERLGWSGAATGGTITVNAPKLFGGEKREGGVAGLVDVLMGGPAQTKNSYLLAKIGPSIPAYRGVVSLVFRGTSSSRSFYWGNNPYLKPVRMRGQRIHLRQDGIAQWYDAKSEIPTFGLGSIAETVVEPHSSGWRYLIEGEASVADYSAPGYDDSGWLTGQAPFYKLSPHPWAAINAWGYGSGTSMPDNSNVWMRRDITFPPNSVLSIAVAADDDPSVWVDGEQVFMAMSVQGLWSGSIAPSGTSAVLAFRVEDSDIATGIGNYIFADIAIAAQGFVSSGDMNPAHIIREALTDPDWGMGYADEDVDDDTFMEAADTLYAESMGISLLWDKQTQLESFISEVIRHIDAALYVSRSTGKFRLKLTRADYDPDELITLDESNIDKIENPTRPAFGELLNSVSVNFWNQATGKPDSVTLQDPAGVKMQGVVINTMVQYQGFTNSQIATRVGDRDLRALSNPFLTCTIYTTETQAAELDIGDCFKLSWSKWHLTDVVMRVTGFAMSDGRTSQVRLTCVEDVFSTPVSAVLVPPSDGWTDPSEPPDPALADDAFEIPYYELVQAMGQTDADTKLTVEPALGFVGAAAVRGNTASIAAELWTDSGAGYVTVDAMDLCPGGLLTAAIDKLETDITVTAGYQDLDLVTVGQHCQIGTGPEAELVRVDAVDDETGEVTIGRGVLDTVPHDHAAGTPVLFWDAYGGFDPTEYITSEVVLAKVTPTSGSGAVDIADAVEHEVTLAGRAYRPYPPGNMTIEGESYPVGASFDGELTITWAHRDRLLQTSGVLDDHFAGNIGPEAGTAYRVRAFIDDVPDVVVDDIAATTEDVTPTAEGAARIEVHSKRDGVYSLQGATVEFIYTHTAGRVTEEADFRYTEDGEVRATED